MSLTDLTGGLSMLDGVVQITSTDHSITINPASGTGIVDLSASGSGGVTSLNSLTGAITLAPGANISITPLGSTLTIAGTGQPLDAALTSIAGVSWVQGDSLYWSGVDTAERLAKDTNATRYLSNQGTSNNPSWNQVDLTNGVTGVLPIANGGDGYAGYIVNAMMANAL